MFPDMNCRRPSRHGPADTLDTPIVGGAVAETWHELHDASSLQTPAAPPHGGADHV